MILITLTSKLLWKEKYHQVKLFAGLNSFSSEIDGIKIHFGQGHDSKEGGETIENIPKNGVGIMDRGFCSKERIRKLLEIKSKFFVMKVKNNMKLEILENGNCLLGGEKDNVEIRIVNFCSRDNQVEYRLATNLSLSEFSDLEIGEIYRKRWAIETLWKFLKMHLKLDQLITKNDNGIAIQIYSCLIGYVILQLTEIPGTGLQRRSYAKSYDRANLCCGVLTRILSTPAVLLPLLSNVAFLTERTMLDQLRSINF